MNKLSILKSIFGCSLLLTPFVSANARQLNPEEALERALVSHSQMRVNGDRHLSLSYTESLDGYDYAYVFNNSSCGFFILSADDRMPAVLGYSDSGEFNLEKASPSLKWWLSQYAEEASATLKLADNSVDTDFYSTRSESEREAIPHLIQTEWDQGYPYNLQCPIMDGERTVTGCVATAMAQVIKYHAYPTNGFGSHSYNDLSFDFENTIFGYDDMIDSYSYWASEESKEAVAQLMYACGVSVNMSYGLEGSSASDSSIAYALRHYFKYDNGVKFLKRDLFTTDQWEDIIYSELSARRPVLYGGDTSKSGHQFICDGYDGDGFFHINWGWSGYGDGFFRLNALDPNYEGIGGADGGYNYNQSIVCGIQPPVAGSKIWYPIYATSSIVVTDVTPTVVNLNFAPGCLYNYSQEPVDVQLLIEAVSADGNVYISEPFPFWMTGDAEARTEYPFDGIKNTLLSGWQYIAPLYLPKNLPAGEYKCSVVMRTPQGNIQEILFPITSVAYFNLTVAQDGSVSYSPGEPEAKANIKVSQFEPASEVVQNEYAEFFLTIENVGDVTYSGDIIYRVFKDGERVNDQDYVITIGTLQPGEDPTYIYETVIDLMPDTYDVIFFDQYGKQISDAFPILIGASGVESIFESPSVDIYSTEGILLMKDADPSAVSSLPKGIYILNAGGKTCKIAR